MRVSVRMFGPLADVAAREDVLHLPARSSTDDVVSAVRERYPDATRILERCTLALNLEKVDGPRPLADGDEVALLPPVSGGAATIHVELTETPSVDRALVAVGTGGAGGTALFVGTVRDTSDAGPVTSLEYSAYDEMAVREISAIAEEAIAKWGLHGCAVEGAVGVRATGEVTFVVACAAPHRDEAFDACRYVTDEVKRRAPVWKKEIGPWGERWVGL